jgi:hypothetical protein
MRNISFMLALLATLAGAACQGKSAPEAQHTQTPAEPAAATQASQQLAYICPMACAGSASDKPGKCPVCGMDLEKNPAHQQPAAADSAVHPAH